jgi:phenylpropionate dioxygenase-like ring-hydroxylating dioxygenase large terminal subunit
MTISMDRTTKPGQTFIDREGFLTIPKERYISKEFAALEAERFWPKVWQIACREEEIPKVGDFVEYEIVDQSILVVRSKPDEIRAYFNSCLHRGTRIKTGCGTARELQCRFHSWRWHLDGSIKSVCDPHSFEPDAITPDALRLPECQVGTWAGFVFINLDPNAEPLREFLGSLPEHMDKYQMEKMRFSQYRTTILPANWKTVVDAFNESYHVQGNHPQICMYLDDTGFIYESYGLHSMMVPGDGAFGVPSPRLGDYAPSRREVVVAALEDFADINLVNESDLEIGRQLLEAAESLPEGVTLNSFFGDLRRQEATAKGIDVSQLKDDDLLVGEDWNIFPNMTTPCNGLNAFVFRARPNGFDPESAIFDVWSLQRPAAGEEPEMVEREFYRDWREHDSWGRITEQDLKMIPQVQKGMHNRSFRYFKFGDQENNIVNFHKGLMSYLEQE